MFAAGNLGASEMPSTLSSPAVAKNCVAVGASLPRHHLFGAWRLVTYCGRICGLVLREGLDSRKCMQRSSCKVLSKHGASSSLRNLIPPCHNIIFCCRSGLDGKLRGLGRERGGHQRGGHPHGQRDGRPARQRRRRHSALQGACHAQLSYVAMRSFLLAARGAYLCTSSVRCYICMRVRFSLTFVAASST